MTMKSFALAVVVVAAFAVPAEAQIWTKVPRARTTPSGDPVLRRAEQTYDGARCELLEVQRNGRREVQRLCDYDRDGVFGDRDDRRIENDRRDRRQGVYANRGQARAAEVHARNEARKREQAHEKRQREILKERQKREKEALKRRQKGNDRGDDDRDDRNRRGW